MKGMKRQYTRGYPLVPRLNAIRELCARCPLAMSADLLQDLAGYKSYKDKSVMMSARSLIQLFRTINPSLLSRKDKVFVHIGLCVWGGLFHSLCYVVECFAGHYCSKSCHQF